MRDDCPPQLVLKKDYRLEDYKRFDERPDIINIDRISDIPSDYYDVMGVPVTFIEKWNPGQFDIVSMVYWHIILDEKGHKIKKMRLLIKPKNKLAKYNMGKNKNLLDAKKAKNDKLDHYLEEVKFNDFLKDMD